MGGYTIAWIVIVSGAIGGAAVLYWLLRNTSKPLIRNLILGVLVAFFVVPAPVPDYTDQLAPAFVVCVFEAFFQIDGEPGVSLRVLLIAMFGAFVVVSAGHYLASKRSQRATSE